jgi:hypothetical protein
MLARLSAPHRKELSMSNSTVISKMSGFASAMLFVAVLADAGPAFGAESCHNINASAVGQDNGDLTTDAVLSNGGLLQGTSHAAFSPTGFDGTFLYFTGVITFTANRATLVVDLSGHFNVTNGAFNAVSTGMTGTGKLEGATGTIELAGLEDLGTGRFTETVSGEICVDLSP